MDIKMAGIDRIWKLKPRKATSTEPNMGTVDAQVDCPGKRKADALHDNSQIIERDKEVREHEGNSSRSMQDLRAARRAQEREQRL